MINWIIDNKDWLFSGAGLTLIIYLYKYFFRNKAEISKTEPSRTEITIIKEDVNNNIVDETSEVFGIIDRLNKFKELLNENREYNRYTISKLAEILELSSVGELESYFKGKLEPNFTFLRKFSDVFGVNYSWLSEGKGQPFYNNKQTNYDPFHYYEYIKELNPEKIYFISSDDKERRTFIILKLSDWKYEIIHRSWHISSHVGAGGQNQIYGMYKLIKKLKERYYLKCYGRILKHEDFNLIYSGNVFPGSIIEFKYHDSPWWDDFTDVDKNYAISPNYEEWYGKEFIAAQRIVKLFLEQEKK